MTDKKIWHIVIEGHDAEQMQDFFEEIQNKYSLYDNCVLDEHDAEDTILDKDRYEETGKILIDKRIAEEYGEDAGCGYCGGSPCVCEYEGDHIKGE